MNRSLPTGTLTCSLGETLLSSWEAAQLAPGDVVLTSRQAGTPGLLLFNNLPLAAVEVTVLKDTFAARIVSTDLRTPFRVDLGLADEVAELVPCTVALGGESARLDELTGLGETSLVNLGVRASQAAPATLLYGGQAFAKGTVVVAEESMALRVTERLGDLTAPTVARSTGNVVAAGSRRIKDYDFRRPDWFSALQIKRIAEVHALFQDNLSTQVPAAANWEQMGPAGYFVDQCTWAEARQGLAEGGLGPLATWEHPSRGSRPPAPPRVSYWESPTCHAPLSAADRARLADDQTHGGVAGLGHPVLCFAAAGLDEPPLSAALRNGWKRFLDFRLSPRQGGAAGLPDHAMVILVTWSSQGRPALALVYPYLTLEPYLPLLGS